MVTQKRWLMLPIGLFLAASSLSRMTAQSQVLVIEGGTLIDGTGREPMKDSVIVIEDSRIKSVGTRKEGSYNPSEARVIRVEGKTVLPGLIDAHVHFLDFMPQLFLHYGVTTIYDTANPTDWIIAQRDAIRKGKILGPRMFVTGAIIDGPPELSEPSTFAARAAYRIHSRNADEARAITRKLVEQGVDAIKVYEGLDIDSLKAVVEVAHSAGLEVVGHTKDARKATLVGMKFIEHATPIAHATRPDQATKNSAMDRSLFDSLIDLMVTNRVYFNPTLTRDLPASRGWFDVVVELLEDPSSHFITAARRESWLRAAKATGGEEYAARMREKSESLEDIQEFIRRFVEAGGKVITGPDSGPRSSPTNMAGLAMAVEMEGLVKAGMTPMQAILASTKWPAELLHKEQDLGTLEPGKLADLIVVDGDPLVDIRSIVRVHAVILDGKIVNRELDPHFRNPLPRTFYVDTPLEYRGPDISEITPKAVEEGTLGATIEVFGRGFTRQSLIRFDISDVPTTFVSDSKLSGAVGGELLKNVGTYAVTVVNPGSGGSTSNVRYVLINFCGSCAPR